jgi:putative sterol carrier protein
MLAGDKMGILFPTDAWVKALQEVVNHSAEYREAARDFEADFLFVVEPVKPGEGAVYFYLDLSHGTCRAAYEVMDGVLPKAGFTIRAPKAVWKKVILKQLDPIQGMITNQLKLKGNMVVMMKNVKPAKVLVECATYVETSFED